MAVIAPHSSHTQKDRTRLLQTIVQEVRRIEELTSRLVDGMTVANKQRIYAAIDAHNRRIKVARDTYSNG